MQGRTRARPRAEPRISAALPALRAWAPGTKGGRGAQDPPFPGPGPSPACPPPPPALVSVHKPLIKQARVTFPLIPPQVRGKLKGMQIQGSAGEVRATRRSGWGGTRLLSACKVPIAPKVFWSRGGEEGGGGGRGGTSGGRQAQDLEVMHNSTAQLSGPPLSWEWEFAPNFVYGTVREPPRPRCLLLLRLLLGERKRLRPVWGM